MGLTAVIITLNEEANIERCLKSLHFTDEIVVLDSFSADRTVELAHRYADIVEQREFTGFSDQWNAALKLARQDWVLIVGADEVITESLAQEITDACADGQYNAYRMPRLAYFLNKPIRGCGWYPDYQLRLVRREKAHFPDRLVHESLVVDCAVGTLKTDILHYSYPSLEIFMRKMVHYARAASEQKIREGKRFRLTDLLFVPGLTFVKSYILKRGIFDGIHGLVLCTLMACSSALRYSFFWEMSLRGGKKKEQ